MPIKTEGLIGTSLAEFQGRGKRFVPGVHAEEKMTVNSLDENLSKGLLGPHQLKSWLDNGDFGKQAGF